MEETSTLYATVVANGWDSASHLMDQFIIAADKAERSNEKLEKQSEQTKSAMQKYGWRLGQVGMQVTDFTEEVQNGIKPLTAIQQQVPQALSAFGPMGVMAGVAVSLAAGIYKMSQALDDSGKAADVVKNTTSELNSMFTAEGTVVNGLAESMRRLSEADHEEYAAKLRLMEMAAHTSYDQQVKSINDLVNSSMSWKTNLSELKTEYSGLNMTFDQTVGMLMGVNDGHTVVTTSTRVLHDEVGHLVDRYGLAKGVATELVVAEAQFANDPTADHFRVLQRALLDATGSANAHKNELLDLASKMGPLGEEVIRLAQKFGVLQSAENGAFQRTPAEAKTVAERLEAMHEQGAVPVTCC